MVLFATVTTDQRLTALVGHVDPDGDFRASRLEAFEGSPSSKWSRWPVRNEPLGELTSIVGAASDVSLYAFADTENAAFIVTPDGRRYRSPVDGYVTNVWRHDGAITVDILEGVPGPLTQATLSAQGWSVNRQFQDRFYSIVVPVVGMPGHSVGCRQGDDSLHLLAPRDGGE